MFSCNIKKHSVLKSRISNELIAINIQFTGIAISIMGISQ